MRPAVFFDRDGVLNRDTGYPHRPEEMLWLDGAMEAVRLANQQGYLVFVVTNQSGIARGFYGEDDVQRLHQWMQEEFARNGARIDAFAYCPHHAVEGVGAYRRECDCRKPKPGMLLSLMQKFGVDAAQSLMLGDRESDMEAAKNAGIKGILFTGGNVAESLMPHLRHS